MFKSFCLQLYRAVCSHTFVNVLTTSKIKCFHIPFSLKYPLYYLWVPPAGVHVPPFEKHWYSMQTKFKFFGAKPCSPPAPLQTFLSGVKLKGELLYLVGLRLQLLGQFILLVAAFLQVFGQFCLLLFAVQQQLGAFLKYLLCFHNRWNIIRTTLDEWTTF